MGNVILQLLKSVWTVITKPIYLIASGIQKLFKKSDRCPTYKKDEEMQQMRCYGDPCPSGYECCCVDCMAAEVLNCKDQCTERPRSCMDYEPNYKKRQAWEMDKRLLILLFFVAIMAAFIFWDVCKTQQYIEHIEAMRTHVTTHSAAIGEGSLGI